ncbi:bifunctional glycosyltransferase family 2 protein/CDP-glycerol:glycerophosphate glycerophosphotransferase [Streptomyces sp. NPDC049590]|uniref:bifunctional glycosyltransferase/CDP-glycerol:glycerophosphate glycerophosphotransferase n=1 Tax=Streptomyces sp. NPDC049590 TaxID=3154834 RepID=UPI00341FA7AD
MPRLSLVVPVYNVQGYLVECLESVLGQDFRDFEIVAVDDCSPDGSGALLDEYAARDERIRVIHLSENVGLGRARNAALEEARGDYVLFLDSDDTLAPGSLAAIAERLTAAGDPDVLIYDYVRTYWNGETRPNQKALLLKEAGPGVFSLAERPQLLSLLQIVCNKAYRRDFIAQEGLTFPPGYYEDALWTFRSLITAERIAVLDRVCLLYRQRREGGNILSTVSRKHFDIFEQYRRVFEFLDTRADAERWRAPIFRKMVDHYLAILERPGRLPRDARAEFFHRAAADYRARTPAGFQKPAGSRGKKYALLERDAYAGLVGAKAVVKLRVKAGGYARTTLGRTRRTALSLDYRHQLRLPLDENLAVFSAFGGRGVTCNPAAIATEVARLAPHIRRVWAVRPDAVDQVPEGVDFVRVGSREYWAALARATYLVNNVNFPDAVVRRPGQIHVQTHRGTPLKSMGLDRRQYPASANIDFAAMLQRCDRWDFSIVANHFSSAVWQRAYPCSYTSLATGYPRNDVLLNSTAEDVREARRALGVAEDATVFLYMPTHREYQRGVAPRLDLEKLAGRLGPDAVLLVRAHPDDHPAKTPAGSPSEGRIIDVSGHLAVERLYLAADCLVTDYSSAMFDYANLDRPIVIYADDWETYSVVRGTYFDVLTQAPGAVATTEEELADVLGSGAWRGERAALARDRFRRRFCDFDDGRAAERVVRHIFLKEDLADLPPVVPLDERTPAPAPGPSRDAPALTPTTMR